MAQQTALRSNGMARMNSPMPDAGRDSGEEVAKWLQEVARRPWVSGPPTVNPEPAPVAVANTRQESTIHRHVQRGPELAYLGLLAIGYLQYYYMDVMVQIGNLPKLVVFVPLAVA